MKQNKQYLFALDFEYYIPVFTQLLLLLGHGYQTIFLTGRVILLR